MFILHRMPAVIAGAVTIIGIGTGHAIAGVQPPIAVSEPMSMALLGAGVGVLYLVKKLRG